MRWQWSQARLTLRLTGAEPLRSSFGSAVGVSIVGGPAVVRRRRVDGGSGSGDEGRDHGGKVGAVMGYLGVRKWAAGDTIECRGARSELRSLASMGRNQGCMCGANLPCVHEGFEKRDHVGDNLARPHR
jgi:hypothetical protein